MPPHSICLSRSWHHFEVKRVRKSFSRSIRGMWRFSLILSFLCGFPGVVVSDHPGSAATELHQSETNQPPFTLSLEGLFHPEKGFTYLDRPPQTHWMGKEDSELLLRKENRWYRVDLQANQGPWETEWPIFSQLCDHVAQIEGLDREAIEKQVAKAIPQMQEPDDAVLVRMDQALIVVSANQPAVLLTRDASAWKDAMLDPLGRRLGYTIDGEMYLHNIESGLTRRLTHDGSPTLLDGRLDWIYQEEIFGRGNYRAFWFSHDANWLAMLRIDTSEVPVSFLPNSKSPRGEPVSQRYSKPGDPIPHASLMIWDLQEFDTRGIPPAEVLVASTPRDEKIIMGVWWHPEQAALYYCLSNRSQSMREILVVDPRESNNGIDHGESSDANGVKVGKVLFREQGSAWIEPPTRPAFLTDGGLVWRSELPSGRNRLYRIGARGDVVYPITPPEFSVEKFVVSQNMAMVLVTGKPLVSKQGHNQVIGERSAFRVQVDSEDGSRTSRLIPLLDCAGWHDVRVSPDKKWVMDRFSSMLTVPQLTVIENSTDSPRRVMIAHHELKVKGQRVTPELFSIPAEDGVLLPAILVRPSRKEGTKVPVVIEVYGGPGLPLVRDRWSTSQILYRELLARQGIATLVVENRSSGLDDASERWKIDGRLGQLEYADLMSAVRWLKEQPWVDTERLAIRGWSFGGFLTLYAMTHSDAFALGIAGGSVTNWAHYDSFYTERYMGSPSENPAGYDQSDLTQAAVQLQGRLLLIHGEADDNVHLAHSLRMASALQTAGKDFQMMIYPGAGHGISEGKRRWHLRQRMHRFLVEQLLGESAGQFR